MAHINFIIPSNKEELLSENDDSYYVKEVFGPKELVSQIKNAKVALMDEGAEFIIEKFDVYYSVLFHSDKLAMDVIFQTYTDLHRAVGELNRAVGFLLEDPESLNDEVKTKFFTMINMLTYIYTQIVFLLCQKNHANDQNSIKARGRKGSVADTKFEVNKKNVILALHNLMQRDIHVFWDPPVLEENFIKLLSEVCYAFLQYPSIKAEKEVRNEIFNLIGNLIKNHNYGTTFVIRSVQFVKLHEHLVQCLAEGIKILVEEFNCKGLVHDFIREVTEWQVDDKYQDGMGARNCANILVEMASSMPSLMLPELLYLNKYLAHESPVLRNCILSVMTEIILNVLTKRELTEENKQYRDDFLAILIDHLEDVASSVRAKVFQHFYRLQKENAIPIKNQNTVLEAAVLHLKDKYCSVRKWAIQCVTVFLSHNIFSANLSLKAMQKELEDKKECLTNIQSKYMAFKEEKIAELEKIWNEKLNALKDVVEEELNKADDDDEETTKMESKEEGEETEVPYDQISDHIRENIINSKFKEAFNIFKKGIEDVEEFEEEASGKNEKEKLDLYINTMKLLFINAAALDTELKVSLQAGNKMSEEDLKRMEELESNVEFLTKCVQYLSFIDQAIEPMIQLLETTSISDMHEAINFFITAYQFNIDNSNAGILAMLRIMQRNEQDRKEAIIKAFKTIYLVTDGKSMVEHTTTIVNRLIGLIKSVSINSIDDLESIIAEWTSKGVLDNSVIDMLWQFFLKNHECSDEDSRAALEILRMAAMGRRTIITKNIKVVSTIAFGERGQKCMKLVGSACKFLQIAGMEKIDTTSDKVPFKIKHHDSIFSNLLEILITNFLEPVPFYNKALIGGVQFIYKLCNKPDVLCEKLLLSIWEKYQKAYENATEIPSYVATRLCQLAGIIAINQLDFLDETVYKELKRRANIREERKKGKSGKVKKKVRPKNNNTSNAEESSNLNASLEESTLEGAVADDPDAEFVLNILENDTVSGSSCLAKFALTTICEQPNIFDVMELQGAAVISLMRYMLVSSKECSSKVQLLFTIFEKTTFSNVKCSILVHLSDLLTRFPNIIEPWTPKIYQRLKDDSIEIRRATFFTLSSLILRDMIRAHKYISDMAICLVDEDKQLVAMCKTFFMQLAHKENNLYNVLPDVFSHLMESETLTEENVQYIMKYLFDLIDKTKHMESLVERFCYKFKLAESEKVHRNISHCLTLITYNDRCLRKLQENFPMYKHILHIGEVYNHFQNILTAYSKPQPGKVDLKPICTEIQEMINSVFELNEDGQMMKPPPTVPKSKRSKRQPVKRKMKSKDEDSDSDEEFSGKSSKNDNLMNVTSSRSSRSKRSQNK